MGHGLGKVHPAADVKKGPLPLCRVRRVLNQSFKVGAMLVSLGFSVQAEHAHQHQGMLPLFKCWDKTHQPITYTAGEKLKKPSSTPRYRPQLIDQIPDFEIEPLGTFLVPGKIPVSLFNNTSLQPAVQFLRQAR